MKKIFLTLFALISISCVNINFKDSSIPLDFTLPLADFTIKDSLLFNWMGIENNLKKNEEGILSIVSSSDFSLRSNSDFDPLFTIEQQNFYFNLNLNLGTSTSDISLDIPENTKFSASLELNDEARIEQLLLESGYIKIKIYNNISNFSDIECTIPQLTKDNIPLKLKVNELRSLNGYTLKIDQNKGNNNQLDFIISGRVDIKKGDNLDNLAFNINIDNLKFTYAKGFLGREEIKLNGNYNTNIDKSISDFIKDSEVYSSNPQIHLNINNQFNVPILIKIDDLNINNSTLSLKQGLNTSKFLLKGKENNVIILDNNITQSQKEFSEIIAKGLYNYKFNFSVIYNPTKEDIEDGSYQRPLTNEISKGQALTAKETLIIPLSGKFKSIKAEQLFSFIKASDNSEDGSNNINNKLDYQNIKIAVLAENQLPINIKINLRAYTKDGDSLDIFKNPILIEASNGYKPQSSAFKAGIIDRNSINIQTLDSKASNILMHSENLKIILEGQSSNFPNKNVNIYSPSFVRIKLITNLNGGLKL